LLVGTGRFELPTPRTPSECSTRLSHVPTRKDSTDATIAVKPPSAPAEGFTQQFYIRARDNTHLVFLSEAQDLCNSSRLGAEVPSTALRIGSSARRRRVPQDATVVAHSLLLQIAPIRPHPHLHLQRHDQRVDFLHMLADQGLHNVHFVFRNFEY
jgi:hypothetical protein